MERTAIDDAEAVAVGADSVRVDLAEALGATAVAINRYVVAPGEGFPGGLHAHADQEEVFVVLTGEATFETLDGEVVVGEGEAVRFARGEFHSGRNAADVALEAIALGAPRETEDVRIPVVCPECDRQDVRVATGDGRDGAVFACPDCGAERVPRDCPECGGEDLQIVLGETDRPVTVCRGCGARYGTPPVRG